jgi:hypothetical protein
MLNIEKLVTVLGWRGEVVGVGARHDGGWAVWAEDRAWVWE